MNRMAPSLLAVALALVVVRSHATSCVENSEEATLEIETVEVDGVPVSTADYERTRIYVDRGDLTMGLVSAPGGARFTPGDGPQYVGCPASLPSDGSSCLDDHGRKLPTHCAWPEAGAACTGTCRLAAWVIAGCTAPPASTSDAGTD